MKKRIIQDKKQTVGIEIKKGRIRIKGSNYYKKMFSRNFPLDIGKQMKKLSVPLEKGLNSVTTEQFMAIMDELGDILREEAYSQVVEAIKDNVLYLDGIRTNVKDRSSIRKRILDGDILKENENISLKKRRSSDGKLIPKSLEILIIDTSLEVVKEEEEELDW